MTTSTQKRLGTAVVVLSLVAALVALWWWALLGMSMAVGIAVNATVFTAFFAGAAIAGAAK